jgi:arsenate reductase
MITVYHNATCSKSNGVCNLLKENNAPVKIVEYLQTPPDKQQLLELLSMLQMQPSQLIRRSEPVFKTIFENSEITEGACLEAMLEHPVLIERPIIVKDGKAMIGRPPEKVLEWL